MQPRAITIKDDAKLNLDVIVLERLLDQTQDHVSVGIRKFWEEPITHQFDRVLQNPEDPVNLNIFRRLDTPIAPNPRILPKERELLQSRIKALKEKEPSARTPIENLLTMDSAGLDLALSQDLTLALALTYMNRNEYQIGESRRHQERKETETKLVNLVQAKNSIAQYALLPVFWQIRGCHDQKEKQNHIANCEKMVRTGIAEAALILSWVYTMEKTKQKSEDFYALGAQMGNLRALISRAELAEDAADIGRYALYFRLNFYFYLFRTYKGRGKLSICLDYILETYNRHLQHPEIVYHFTVLFKLIESELQTLPQDVINTEKKKKLLKAQNELTVRFNFFAQTQTAAFVTLLSYETQRDQAKIFNFLDENGKNAVRAYITLAKESIAQTLSDSASSQGASMLMPKDIGLMSAGFLLPNIDSKQTDEEAWQEIVGWEKMLSQKVTLSSSQHSLWAADAKAENAPKDRNATANAAASQPLVQAGKKMQ